MFALKTVFQRAGAVVRPQVMLFSGRITGTVKFFDSVKGYGFIAPNDATPDVFVHQTNIKTTGFRSLGEGEKVEFQVEENKDTGKRFAIEVTGPDGAPPKGAPRSVNSRGGDGFDAERRPRGGDRRSRGGEERY